jgi:hypothetical protein
MQAQANCPRTCLTALEMLSSAGSVSADDVRTYFRFGATEKLVKALECLSSDPKAALAIISELLDSEGPSWVRDTAILAITSAVRASVGAKPTVVVPSALYATRGPIWISVAKSLGQLDKPNAADVETVLLEAIPNLPAAAPPSTDWQERLVAPPVQAAPSSPVQAAPPPMPDALVKIPEPKSEVKAEPLRRIAEPKPKILEIDGVSFSASEKLTSVDDRLEMGSRGAPVAMGPTSAPGVRLDKDFHPMTPKEFSRGFLERTKREG